MRVIILCGGSGTRLADYSLPKPLNMIHGKPSIAYCLQNLPTAIQELHFIAAPHLAKYNFEEIIKNQFKGRTCHVHWIPYFTRGPIETAWLGTNAFPDTEESVVFLDNDVVYNFPEGFFQTGGAAFLGYAKDTSTSEAYSFLTVDNGLVTNYKEKKRISDNFCCGVYGFKDITQFRSAAKEIMRRSVDSELYMSTLFQYFLEERQHIQGIYFSGDVYHIGSLNELQLSWSKLKKEPMRICFDLDNTLVTYPSIPGDYTTVKPISSMIDLARTMKAEGHTIIIHTARRMATHKHNVGAVIRDIGALTFQTLEDFQIPYDEILFGKPIADIYIDDRAVNPYRDSVQSMGYLYKEEVKPMNMIPNNKYNNLCIINDKVVKTGPTKFIKGEIHFYEQIPYDTVLGSYFPKFYGASKGQETSTLLIENIKSIPFYTLFKEQLITKHHILQLFEVVDMLHHVKGSTPSESDVMANYTDKLKARFAVKEDYPFPDARIIQERCLADLSGYVPRIAGFIHGDLWFSNILFDFKNNIKLIDMKGQVNGSLITGGDILYDYGKLYQSFLGYDAVLYKDVIPESYITDMRSIFLSEVEKRGLCLKDLDRITQSLMIGTLHALESLDAKTRIWDFIKKTYREGN